MNALYCCCITDIWVDVAEHLQEELSITPAYFIAWKADLEKNDLREHFPNTFIHTVENAWKGLGFPTKTQNNSLDELTIKKYSFEINNGIKMIDRLDPMGTNFSFTERNYWFISLIENWLTVIDEYNLNIVISPSVPHRVFDYALYIAAQIRGCKFLMFQMTPFGDSSFIIDDVSQTSQYMKKNIELEVKNNNTDFKLTTSIKNKIQSVRGTYDEAIPDYMVQQNKRVALLNSIPYKLYKTVLQSLKMYKSFSIANTYKVQKSISPSQSAYNQIQFKFEKYKGVRYKKRLKRAYSNIVTPVPVNTPYILVALHYQPEETSCPTGGVYAEQRQIIKNLSDILPDNVKILIKEHTTQFHPDFEGEAGRSLNYYQDLQQISKRISLVSPNLDTFELIDSALATITISGTIGWESVLRGTPAIIFGRSWYEDMPGVFKVKSKKELSNTITTLLSGYLINNDSVNKYHALLEKFLISSIHYKAFEGKNISSKKESVVNLTNGIKRFLKDNV